MIMDKMMIKFQTQGSEHFTSDKTYMYYCRAVMHFQVVRSAYIPRTEQVHIRRTPGCSACFNIYGFALLGCVSN